MLRCTSLSDLANDVVNMDVEYAQMKITPILLAAQRDSFEILELLLKSGMNYIPKPHRVVMDFKL